MITIPGTTKHKIRQLADALGKKAPAQLKRNIAVAVNAAAKKGQSHAAKSIGGELATTQKVIKGSLKLGDKATKDNPGSSVTVKATRRIPLRDFGARQNKIGVSYRVSKRQGRRVVAGAFQGPKPGAMKASWRGRVFKRDGKSRLPIAQLFGASPWGVFAGQKMKGPTEKVIRAELLKQLDRRIRFIKLKAEGKI